MAETQEKPVEMIKTEVEEPSQEDAVSQKLMAQIEVSLAKCQLSTLVNQ